MQIYQIRSQIIDKVCLRQTCVLSNYAESRIYFTDVPILSDINRTSSHTTNYVVGLEKTLIRPKFKSKSLDQQWKNYLYIKLSQEINSEQQPQGMLIKTIPFQIVELYL